ncbi:MAG: hypothetical protein ABR884_03450 [Minisyncoccia bacterium]|jgi:hypothetical protein
MKKYLFIIIPLAVLSFALQAAPAYAAVAIDATSSPTESALNTTSVSLTYTVGSGSNRALVAHLSWAGCTPLPTGISVTWDSGGTNQAMTLMASSSNTSDPGLTQLWGLVAPTSGNKTLKASWTNGCTTGSANLAALSVTGANQTGGTTTFAQATSSTNTNSSWTQTVVSASGDLAVTGSGSVNTVPTPTNQTTWYSVQGANAENSGASYAAGASTVSFSYSGGGWSGYYEIVGFDIVAAAGGSAPTHYTSILTFNW